ncbi:phage tail fiber protein [Xenorhabdus stockiae]|uniref:phage tail fiber protein n=1 Tax=Xenorhabdus stockiae TaxID=351614 RepID=UPI004064401F
MQDKKLDAPDSDDSNLVIVATPEYVKEAIAEHAASRNHPNATLKDKGFVVLSNDVSDSETMAATPKAVKTAYDLANTANQNASTRLSKEQNGADIPDKAEFVKNLGSPVRFTGELDANRIVSQDGNKRYMLGVRNNGQAFLDYWNGDKWTGEVYHPKKSGTMMLIGDYGIGSSGTDILNNMEDSGYKTGFYSYTETTINRVANFGSVIKACYNSSNQQMIILPNFGDGIMYIKRYIGGRSWENHKVMTSNMWVEDRKGYYQRPSPTINIWNDGRIETNEKSQGVTAEHLSKGIYLIKGITGFSNGEAVSSIDIPRCQNDLPLIWVDHEVLPDGSIKLMTYHREHSDAPAFARNIREGYSDGDLIDIPDGRFVSVRVQMPDTK